MSGPDSPAEASSPVATGDVLAGKYWVDRVLGVGGMGVVVAATHLKLDQQVALKFMLPEGVGDADLVERFAREARAAVKLKSDHVARVLDVGTLDSGSPYMVMEYLEGSDLGSLVESSGPLPVLDTVDYVLQACDAVAEAHTLGIVHRDLKPRNLFLTGRNDGRALVKVLDFGISKHKAASELSLTRSSEVIGSPNYMSPEQLKSARAADERSDIWALGVILYELLTGRVPFVAESVTALTAMVLTDRPRAVDQLRPEVPHDLAVVIAKCLEKEPASRFQSIAELAAGLEAFAPPDTRDLALRIARMAGGSKVPLLSSQSSAKRIAVSGATSVNWSAKTELASTGKKGTMLFAIAFTAIVGSLAVVIALVLALRPGTPGAGATSSGAAPPQAVTTIPVTSSLPVVLAPITPSNPAAPVMAPSTTASVAASTGAHPGHAPAASAPIPAGSSVEPPAYRTSW